MNKPSSVYCFFITSTVCFLLMLCNVSFAQIAPPYFNDFENGATGWSDSSFTAGTNWQLGMPAFGVTNTTHSGNNCWDINLTTSYADTALSYLYTPVFDFSNGKTMLLSFWHNYYVETGWDGLNLEYSIDTGNTWQLLGSYMHPYSENWYNDTLVQSFSGDAWTNNSNGWYKSSYRLNDFIGVPDFRLRFVFRSDNSFTKDGYSIDDFNIEIFPDTSLALVRFQAPSYYPPLNQQSADFIFKIGNLGAKPISNFTFGYLVNGVPQSSSVFQGTLLPFDDIQLTLPGLLISPGNKTITGYISVPNDVNNQDDSAHFSLTPVPIYDNSFHDNFDQYQFGWINTTYGNTFSRWQLGTPVYGANNTAYSPPKCWDINLTNGYYPNAHATLQSPWFNLSAVSAPIIKFMQNTNVDNIYAGCIVEWTTYDDTLWHILGTLNDTNGVNWYNGIYSYFSNYIPAFTGYGNTWEYSAYKLNDTIPINKFIQFRFRFLSNSGSVFHDDGVSIDDFILEAVMDNDAYLRQIISPSDTAIENKTFIPKLKVVNRGTVNITSLPLYYEFNGQPAQLYNWSGNISSFDSLIISLPPVTPVHGINTLKIYADLINDQYKWNDTITKVFIGHTGITIPYTEDFETGDGNWYTQNLYFSKWEYGSPNFGVTNTSHSGNNCWDINLFAPYSSLSISILISPIFDIDNVLSTTLTFWHNYNTELNADGFRAEYTTDGAWWEPLGSIGDPNATNWYNSTIFQGHEAWSGNSGGWSSSSYSLSNPTDNHYLQFRFIFTSNILFSGDGVSVDDFSLSGVVGGDENPLPQKISIFPNPTTGRINFSIGEQDIQHIRINSIEGKTIYEEINIGSGKNSIDLSFLEDGIYLFELSTETGISYQKKIVVRH